MSSQSWTAWLLDSYASSVQTSHEPSESIDLKNDSSALPMGSAASTPYVRTGRGGAGNFHWDAPQSQSQTNDDDVEIGQKPTSSLAERRQAASRLERLEINDAMATKRVSSAPYMHVGRGGAGNYTQSNDIQSATTLKSPRSASAVYAPSATPNTTVPTVGRGGAGNVMAALDAKSRLQQEKEEQEREVVEKRRERIEQQVAGMLQPPPGAMIASATRRSSMILDV